MSEEFNDIILPVTLIDQRNCGADAEWAYRICGVCCLSMLMLSQGKAKVPAMDLVKKGIEVNAYKENVGWKHQGLVDMAAAYDLPLEFIKHFPKTPEQKTEKMQIIKESILAGNPVIASMRFSWTPEGESHLVIINGIRFGPGSSILGFHIQDPDNFASKAFNYLVTTEDFLACWRGGLIYRKLAS